MHFKKKSAFWASGIIAFVICIIISCVFFSGAKKGADLLDKANVEEEVVFTEQSETKDAQTPPEEAAAVPEETQSEQKSSTPATHKRHSKQWEHVEKNDPDVYFVGRSEDKAIVLEWNVPYEHVNIIITDKSNKIFPEIKEQVNSSGTYRFTDGAHGDVYRIMLEYGTGEHMFAKKLHRKFLDFDLLPKTRILYIDTKDGFDPEYEKAKKPERGLFGVSIINNEYKEGILNKDIPMKLRIRGNSSAYGEKKSYKVVLSEKKDLLGLGDEYADKEWILLGKSSVLKTYFGFEMGKLVGMEWQPRMEFVNLIMNGDWKGLYILCEGIKPHPKRVALDEDGFLIESDSYYWKEKDPKFTSPLLSDRVQFTFKYPKFKSGDNFDKDERFLAIKKRIKEIDDAIEQENHDIGNLVDFDTFAGWAIAHDIMGTTDSLGSNMFFYQQSVGKKTKLKMGPLWDFDSILPTNGSDRAPFWDARGTYLPYLFNISAFRDFYKEKYFKIVASIEPSMRKALEKLKSVPDLEESILLDRGRIMRYGTTLDEELDAFMQRLHKRIEKLNVYMEGV